MVGTSGNILDLFLLVTAKAFNFLVSTYDRVDAMVPNKTGTWPAITSIPLALNQLMLNENP